jgi:hypothetical protein
MRGILLLMLIVSAATIAFSEDLINDTSNATTVNATNVVESPWTQDSKICIFLREWILKGAFLVILMMFILGVAIFSGAAFPQWREKGGMMILGAIAAVILYNIGLPVLKLFMGGTVCGF